MTSGRNPYTPPGKRESFWIDTMPPAQYSGGIGDIGVVDVAVLGAGIAGVSTAALFKREGLSVALIEAERALRGVTGKTTAKVTSLHNAIYHTLTSDFDEDIARLYGEANQKAIEHIAANVKELGIDCDFERRNAYTYTTSKEHVEELQEEAEVARKLGLPASFVNKLDLPFSTHGAVRFENQARFHPTKYLVGLLESCRDEGFHVIENTRAQDIEEGDPCVIKTTAGDIRAKKVVITTHFPFYDGAPMYAARMHASRSYVMGVRLRSAFPDEMFLQMEEPMHSFRVERYKEGDVIIAGGGEHKTGQGGDTLRYYERLESYIRDNLDVESIDWSWSTQDNMTVDGVPYIGKFAGGSEHLFIATGFNKWGMTTGTAAGLLLRDLVQGRLNPWAQVYDPTRFKPVTSAWEFVSQNLNIAQEFISGMVRSKSRKKIGDVLAEEGIVTTIDKESVAVFKDRGGEAHILNAKCTHMKCIVSWNDAEHTWDCPCHGSRFSAEGKVIHGPATMDLEKRDDLKK